MLISSMVGLMDRQVIVLLIHPFALVLPFLLFLFFFYKFSLSSYGKNLPPSPPKLPIIGNLHQIGSRPHRSLKTLSQRYGELMLVHLGSKPTLVISSKEMASQALKALDSSFSGRPKTSSTKTIFYNCKGVAFSPYGEHWRRMKSMCMLQLFTNKRVKSFGRVREEEVALMIEKIKKSSVVNLSKLFFTLTNNLICREAYGRNYRGEEGGVDFERMIVELVRVVGSHNIEDTIPWMGWINRFNGVNDKINKISKDFDDVLEIIIKEHMDRAKESTREDSESVKDFVDILLELQRNNPTDNDLDKEAIKAVVLDMFVGGTHTGSVTLEWTFTELMRHPRVMKRLQEEVRRVTGDKEAVAEEDIEKMTYMKAVIKESFRFHPAAPLLVPRECTQDVKMEGYDIPMGTQAVINAWAIGRDPRYWEEPDKFVPERFLDSAIDYKGQHFELLPFGGGRRGCPGISLSIAGIELALANLVYQFDWGLPNGASFESVDISETKGSLCHKNAPLILVATPRMAQQQV